MSDTRLAAAFDPPMKGNGSELDPPMSGNENRSAPLIAEALRRSRAQTDDYLASSAGSRQTKRVPPSSAHAKSLWFYAPEVRAEIAVNALLSQFQRSGTGLAGLNAGGSSVPVVALTLPTGAALVDPSGLLDTQAQFVLDRTEVRADRMPEILVQADSLWPFWTAVTHLGPVATPRTHEFVVIVQRVCSALVHGLKYAVGCPRPVDVSPVIQPVIDTPGHASLPSGHGAAAYCVAELLDALLDLGKSGPVWTQLERIAWRITDNRVVAGVHFPMDGIAGQLVGRGVARYVLSSVTVAPAAFSGGAFDATAVAPADLLLPNPAQTSAVPQGTTAPVGAQAMSNDVLKEMWDAARTELSSLGMR